MLDQGYCPVCEGDWKLPVGALCPKHDLELEPGPSTRAPRIDPAAGATLVTIRSFARAGEAEAARIRLEAEGIPTFLQGERMGTNGMYHVATGGVKLQVPQELAADARILLAQSWAPPFESDEWDEADAALAPEPALGPWQRMIREMVLLGAVVVFLTLLGLVCVAPVFL
jgi:hypothetical protein